MNKKEFILKNKYFAVRHGESWGNVEKRIVSDFTIGCQKEQGLTEKGVEQVTESASVLAKKMNVFEKKIVIISSPFSRAVQTASILKAVFFSQICFTDMRLKERWFGELDLKTPSQKLYEKVWDLDRNNADHTEWGVQSVNSVIGECTSLISDCENNFKSSMIFFASHGDRLQIMQTIFEGISPRDHRLLQHLKNGEIRQLKKRGA